MAQVTVRINGYAYTVGCEDGQEAHLVAMAEQVDKRIEDIKTTGGQSGEGKLLVLAALLMADELHDQAIALEQARAGHGGPDALTGKSHHLAERAEAIAAALDTP